MSATLEDAIALIRRMPPDRQAELAEAVMAVAAAPHAYSAQEHVATNEGLVDAEAGRVVSDADFRETLARFGR